MGRSRGPDARDSANAAANKLTLIVFMIISLGG
jgi:hypothetical protein